VDDLTFECRPFASLGGAEVYAVLALRSRVFVVEQACVYLDPDGLDVEAQHVLGWRAAGSSRVLVCGARILAPGAAYAESSIGRVVTLPEHRGAGLGRRLMLEALGACERLYPGQGVRIGAQRYLEGFYASLGFVVVSAPYVEDGIPHVTMVRGG
jgi:ElaA protein